MASKKVKLSVDVEIAEVIIGLVKDKLQSFNGFSELDGAEGYLQLRSLHDYLEGEIDEVAGG